MENKPIYTLVLIYSNTNQQSIKTLMRFNEIISECSETKEIINIQIDYEKSKKVAQELGVSGTPALVVLKDGDPIKRLFGELSSLEMRTLISNIG